MDPVGEGEGGMIWENGIETCIILILFKKLFFFFFLAVLCGLRDLSSLTKDGTPAHGSESVES